MCNLPTVIISLNAVLTAADIKENQDDPRPIQVRSAHRHPSNDLIVYTTTANQADRLRDQSESWLPQFSANLVVKRPVYPVVVHGIPTSFNPTSPDHLRMLEAMNPDTFKTPPLFVKWISQQAVQRGSSHSSIRIGFSNAEKSSEAVKNRIFYGRFNKRTKNGQAAKARCMNCLLNGHTSKHCKETGMCLYCASNQPADSCEIKGTMTSNCTAGARHLKKNNKALFSATPASLHHSPLDPTCPTRIALAVKRERRATAARAEEVAKAAATPKSAAVSPNQPAVATTNVFQPLQESTRTAAAAPISTDTTTSGRPEGGEDSEMAPVQ